MAAQYSQADVENGFRLFGVHCSTCHGAGGDAVPGIDMRRGQFRRAASDADLTRIISAGIPGTAMPPNRFVSADLAGLVAYIRSMRDFDTRGVAPGDAGRGQSLFEGKGGCAKCHRVNSKGSRTGPDLSDIGAVRSPQALQQSILDANASVLPMNRSIRALTRDGKTIRGRRLNEDTYTVQIIDDQERLQSLDKSGLREYIVVGALVQRRTQCRRTRGSRGVPPFLEGYEVDDETNPADRAVPVVSDFRGLSRSGIFRAPAARGR